MTESELKYQKFNALFICEYRVNKAGADIHYTERKNHDNSGKVSGYDLESAFENVFDWLGITLGIVDCEKLDVDYSETNTSVEDLIKHIKRQISI